MSMHQLKLLFEEEIWYIINAVPSPWDMIVQYYFKSMLAVTSADDYEY